MCLNFLFDCWGELIPRKHFLDVFYLIPCLWHEINSRQRNKIFRKGKGFYDLTFNVISRGCNRASVLVSMHLQLCCHHLLWQRVTHAYIWELPSHKNEVFMTKLIHCRKNCCFLEILKPMAVVWLK